MHAWISSVSNVRCHCMSGQLICRAARLAARQHHSTMLVFYFGSSLHTGRIDQHDENNHRLFSQISKPKCWLAAPEAKLTSCHNEAQRRAGHSLQHAPSFVCIQPRAEDEDGRDYQSTTLHIGSDGLNRIACMTTAQQGHTKSIARKRLAIQFKNTLKAPKK